MSKLNVLVAGSTGYIGIQLIKLLLKHNKVNIKYLCGNSSVGKKVSFFDQSLKLKKLPNIVKFNKSFLKNVDLIFTALPNGKAQELSKHLLKKNVLIDLAADFRLQKAQSYLKWYKQNHRANSKIKDIDFPRSAIIGGVINNGKGIIALGDYRILPEDRVVVSCLPEAVEKVESLFS